MTDSNYETLQFKLNLSSSRYNEVKGRFWAHENLAIFFPEQLFRLHSLMRASVPLMEAALKESKTLAKTDGVCRALVPYFEEHIEEEQNHDVWILDDLESLGIDRSEAIRRVPSAKIASLVGSQYYWINHFHPVALLGYIALLECIPPTKAFLDSVQEKTKLPSSAFRTLHLHADADVGHAAELKRFIDSLDLAPHHEYVLGVNGIHSQELLADSLDEIILRNTRNLSISA
jgi:hypothetical protein